MSSLGHHRQNPPSPFDRTNRPVRHERPAVTIPTRVINGSERDLRRILAGADVDIRTWARDTHDLGGASQPASLTARDMSGQRGEKSEVGRGCSLRLIDAMRALQ